MKKSRISLCIIAKNEESKIANIRLDFNVKYIDELIEIIPDTEVEFIEYIKNPNNPVPEYGTIVSKIKES